MHLLRNGDKQQAGSSTQDQHESKTVFSTGTGASQSHCEALDLGGRFCFSFLEKEINKQKPNGKKCCTLLQNINTIVLRAGGAWGALPSEGTSRLLQGRGEPAGWRPPPDTTPPPAAGPSFTSSQNLSALELPSENCQASGAPWALRQPGGYVAPREHGDRGEERCDTAQGATSSDIFLF